MTLLMIVELLVVLFLLTDLVKAYPWTIAIAFFLVSVLINSQGAVVVAMLPLAYLLGIDAWILLGVMPSVYGYIAGLGISYLYHFVLVMY